MRIRSLFVAVLMLAVASGASALTAYTYSGNNYTTIIDNTPPAGATYDTSMSVTGTFSTLAPLAANMALTDISGDVTDYSFDDGANTLNSGNSVILGAFSVATDALGNITEWQLTIESGPPLPTTGGPGDQRFVIQTSEIAGLVIDRGILQECLGGTGGSCGSVFSDIGQVTNNAGSWSVVPEPSTGALLALGLIGIAARRSRRGC